MCFHIIFENVSQTHQHRLNDLLLTRLPQRQFQYKSLKQIMQCDASSVLLSDDETSAYFMAWGRHFG